MLISEAEAFMSIALEQGQRAFAIGEVPVGAVIIKENKVISFSHNLVETKKDPTAHAELLAIRDAAHKLGDWRLRGCDLYVTLEPCAMCVGACIGSRLDTIIFGAYDKVSGCCASVADLADGWLPHSPKVVGGVLEGECSAIMTKFFKERRNKGV